MSKAILNLTVPTVVAEVEQILETYPHHPHQQLFANPDVRQELIAFVLTHIHNVYGTIDEAEHIEGDLEEVNPAETWIQSEAFIHQGIHDILQRHQASAEHQIPEEEGYLTASHWFG
ncbi:MAG: hypothetical protein WCA35_00945 [Kovacikia sp.]